MLLFYLFVFYNYYAVKNNKKGAKVMLTEGKAVIHTLIAVLFLTMIVFDLTIWNVLYSLILFYYVLKIKMQ